MEETMVKGVILDFNGTLFFDSQFHDIAWKMISKEIRGYEMSDEELINHMHGKNNEMVIKYLKSDIDDETNKKYSLLKEEKYRQMCKAHPDMFHLAPGVITFFEYLNNHHIPFTIASASIKENIDFFIESFESAKYMDVSKIVYDDGSYPDKITMFEHAASLLNTTCDQCLIVEDSVSGIKFAKAVNAKYIVAVNSDHNIDKYAQFDYLTRIINDFDEFCYDII